MEATSVNKIVESSKNTKIPPINGEPTYTTIHSLQKLFNANTSSVSTKFRCGNLGQLCLTFSPTFYTTLLETLVMPPPNTRAAPIIPVGATGIETVTFQYSHNAAAVAFNNFQNMDCALCQQLLGTLEENYVRVLHRPHVGYSGSSTLDLITHLYTMYT